MPMPEDTFTNTPEDAADYERERAESAGEFDAYYDELDDVRRNGAESCRSIR